jgi:hypothetical protein
MPNSGGNRELLPTALVRAVENPHGEDTPVQDRFPGRPAPQPGRERHAHPSSAVIRYEHGGLAC